MNALTNCLWYLVIAAIAKYCIGVLSFCPKPYRIKEAITNKMHLLIVAVFVASRD